MLQTNVLVGDRPAVATWTYGDSDRPEILRVLERAADDDRFISQLTYRGDDALQGYLLTTEAQAALLGGDVQWIEARVGELDGRSRTWLDCRLQQEIW